MRELQFFRSEMELLKEESREIIEKLDFEIDETIIIQFLSMIYHNYGLPLWKDRSRYSTRYLTTRN